MNYQGTAHTIYVMVENLEALQNALDPWTVEVAESSLTPGMVAVFDISGDGWPTFSVDEEGQDIEFDVATLIMPFVREAEVLVVMEAGFEGSRHVAGDAKLTLTKCSTHGAVR